MSLQYRHSRFRNGAGVDFEAAGEIRVTLVRDLRSTGDQIISLSPSSDIAAARSSTCLRRVQDLTTEIRMQLQDDEVFDGDRTVSVTFAVPGHLSYTWSFLVTDDEAAPQLAVSSCSTVQMSQTELGSLVIERDTSDGDVEVMLVTDPADALNFLSNAILFDGEKVQ